MRNTLRNIWYDYRSEVVFGLVLSALLVASAWFSHLIPVEIFDRFINPALSIALAAICFFGGWLCLRHHEGIRVRKEWATMLIAWGIMGGCIGDCYQDHTPFDHGGGNRFAIYGRNGCGLRIDEASKEQFVKILPF